MAEATIERGNRLWEEEMLAEYLARFHRGVTVLHRVRLGPPGNTWSDPALTESERTLVGASWRRWADAVIIEPGRLVVVEAALVPKPGDISQLELYLQLVDVTPELAPYRGLPRRGLLVWAVDDPYTHPLAVSRGLEVRIFKGSNFLEWLEARRAGERRQARPSVTPLPTPKT